MSAARQKSRSRVQFEPEKINALLGTRSYKRRDARIIFGRVELAYDEATDEIVAPTFRQDLHCTADVAEEVARFYGYDKIPTDTSYRRGYYR